MNKEKALKVLAGTSNAQKNKLNAEDNGNSNADLWQQDFSAICLICRKNCHTTQRLEVVIFNRRKAVAQYGICHPCEREISRTTQVVTVRVKPVGTSKKAEGVSR